MQPQINSPSRALAIAIMVATPAFFATNLVFGRHVVAEVAPFTLAFLRWAAVALLLFPVVRGEWPAIARVAHGNARLVMTVGFLGMFVCGGAVYFALRHTTATNGTLIYSASPIVILFVERLLNARPIGRREALGSLVAFAGVAAILLRGDWSTLAALRFNAGDLVFVAAAIAWGWYSVRYRHPAFASLSNAALFFLVAAAGALTLAPAALAETLLGGAWPASPSAWRDLAGIVLFSSLIAFSGYQYGIRVLGAPLAAAFMYLLPVWGVAMAVVFLGEAFHPYHAAGIALVLAGVLTATFPAALMRKRGDG